MQAKKKQILLFAICSPDLSGHFPLYAYSARPRPSQVFLLPPSVCDHRTQCADRKRVIQRVIGHYNSPAISVSANSMTAANTLKSITFQSPDEKASRQTAGVRVIH